MKRRRTLHQLLCSWPVVWRLFSGSAQDLVTRGAINGRVCDQAGAAIANAKVTVSGRLATASSTPTRKAN